jgi:hypothetical protein
MAPQFEIYFSFRGKQRNGRARKYSDGSYSVGFVSDDEILKHFAGMLFIAQDGSVSYGEAKPTAPDKLDFERAIKEQLR